MNLMTILSWKGALLVWSGDPPSWETPRPTGRVTRPVALSATRDSFKPALLTSNECQSKIECVLKYDVWTLNINSSTFSSETDEDM